MKRTLTIAAIALFALTGCASDGESSVAVPEPSETVTPTPIEAPTPTVVEPEAPSFPEGYPYIVDITEIPEHMRSKFEMTGTGQAVAVAPGVWTEMSPGATLEDAANAGVFHGFCASKEAFEREYRDGKSTAGVCW